MRIGCGLAPFRILIGVLSLGVFASLWPHWQNYFSAAFYLSPHSSLQNLIENSWTLYLAVLASLLLIVGYQARLMCCVLWLILWGLAEVRPSFVTAADEILRMFLFLSLFAELTSSAVARAGTVIPLRLLQFNFLSIYLAGAVGKIVAGSAWLSGTALAAIMVDPNWGRYQPGSLEKYAGILMIANYLVLFFEISFPVMILFRRIRWAVLLSGFFFHLSIALLMKNLILFSFAMICDDLR